MTPQYAHDPDLAPVPLDPDEVAELLKQRPRAFVRDEEHVWLLVERAQATAAALRHQSQQFDLEMQARSAAMPRSGIPGNISPEQAARFLSPQQLRRLFDTFSKERLDALDQNIKRVDEQRQRLHSLADRLETVLDALERRAADQPDGDEGVEVLRELLDDLHDSAAALALTEGPAGR
jgi:hypothetical protein